MITANIDINKNKLEEFVRVLLPEYYEILSENTEKNICITVNETLQLITVKSSVIIGGKTVKETELSYEKIGSGGSYGKNLPSEAFWKREGV